MTNRAPIECFYRLDGWRVVGSCPELALEAPPAPDRDAAEMWISRLVAKALDLHGDDLCLKHHPTGTAP